MGTVKRIFKLKEFYGLIFLTNYVKLNEREKKVFSKRSFFNLEELRMKAHFFRLYAILFVIALLGINAGERFSVQAASSEEKKPAPRQNIDRSTGPKKIKPAAPPRRPSGPQMNSGLKPRPTVPNGPKPSQIQRPTNSAGTPPKNSSVRPEKRPEITPNHPKKKQGSKPSERPGRKPERGEHGHGNFHPEMSPHSDSRHAPPHPPHHPDFHSGYYPYHPRPWYHPEIGAGPLFFFPPPYIQEEIFVYSPLPAGDGFRYYEEAEEAEGGSDGISLEELADPINRYYFWDAFRYYGWLQQYVPFHESWTEACDAGTGFAAGYDLSLTRYHYYPINCVRPGTERIEVEAENPIIFEPNEEKRKILPQIQETLAVSDVEAAWDLIYAGDTYFQKGKDFHAEENYVRAMTLFPEMPDPYFRLAVIQVSRLQYALAAENIQKSLKLSQVWPASPFALDRMYGSQKLQKNGDLASLLDSANQNPGDAELQMVCGFMLYSNALGSLEQGKQAQKYFKRAIQADSRFSVELGRLISFLDFEIQRVENE